jgi:hypothetical protein
MNTFPTLRLGVLQSLQGLKQQFTADSGLFERDGCPYDRETVEVLRGLMETTVVEVERVVERVVEVEATGRGVTDEDMGVVEDELRLCLKDLREISKEREGVAKADDETLLKLIKAKSTLIEQIVKMRERVMNLRRQSEFETMVVGILEELVSEDDRAVFLTRLKPYRDR